MPDQENATQTPRRVVVAEDESLIRLDIVETLRDNGFEVVGEFHCAGFDTVGPLRWFGGLNRHHPDERDLNSAAAFARRLLIESFDADSAQPLVTSQ